MDAREYAATKGAELGLRMVNQPVGMLEPGFSVSVTVTGVAADADCTHRSHVEATVAAKIAHSCFSTGVLFWANEKVGEPIKFTFAQFDDGWRVVRYPVWNSSDV
jgi:hypothetical protein